MWQVGQTGELVSETAAVDALYAQVIRGDYKALRVTIRDGKLRITAPSFMSEQTIRAILTKRREWIETKLANPRKKRLYKGEMRDGGVVYLYGHPLTLRVDTTASRTFIDVQRPTELIVASYTRRPGDIREAVTVFMKERFAALYNERAPQIIAKMPKKPIAVVPSNAKKSYWGRCHYQSKKILLSWRIACLPVECFDYLLVHELSHLEQPNHSPAFWAVVAKYCPNYKEAEKLMDSADLPGLV